MLTANRDPLESNRWSSARWRGGCRGTATEPPGFDAAGSVSVLNSFATRDLDSSLLFECRVLFFGSRFVHSTSLATTSWSTSLEEDQRQNDNNSIVQRRNLTGQSFGHQVATGKLSTVKSSGVSHLVTVVLVWFLDWSSGAVPWADHRFCVWKLEHERSRVVQYQSFVFGQWSSPCGSQCWLLNGVSITVEAGRWSTICRVVTRGEDVVSSRCLLSFWLVPVSK